MTVSNKREFLTLFLGDAVVFVAALWLTLFVRYHEVPSRELFQSHFVPFSILFLLWALVFFIAGLYEKHTTFLKGRLPTLLLRSQVVNSVIAVLFFYFLPYFGINPKTNLFIYLVISFFIIWGWRAYLNPAMGFRKREKAILVGGGGEMRELQNEINNNDRYSVKFVSSVDLNDINSLNFQKDILDIINSNGVSYVVVDLQSDKIAPILPKLYDLIFSGVKFINIHKVYEDTFDRIPLSLLNYAWFLEYGSHSTGTGYDFLKRLMDISISLALGILSLALYPFVFLAIKLEDKGRIFIVQERIGRGNKNIRLIKFRSMKVSDTGVWPTEEDSRMTKVGKFLRKTRIDELPQLWNVVLGDISLIGPRPDIIDLGRKLSKEIPYYTVRNLIKPGLSGWAQIKQDVPPHSVEETKNRLSYDLYYVKNRSFTLDLRIALQTIRTLLSRSGK